MSDETRKVYRSQDIAVAFDSRRCIHTARCLRNLPQVFDLKQRPWIKTDAATANEIADAVSKCPSGALTYERLDGGPAETAPAVPVIMAIPNGPLSIHGLVELTDKKSGVIAKELRMTLCRCGQSSNKPYCDNTHKAIGFKTE